MRPTSWGCLANNTRKNESNNEHSTIVVAIIMGILIAVIVGYLECSEATSQGPSTVESLISAVPRSVHVFGNFGRSSSFESCLSTATLGFHGCSDPNWTHHWAL